MSELRKSYWMTVLDTSVLVHDPYSILKFGSVYIPRVVIHELDGLKKGKREESRNAREASRLIQSLIDTIDRSQSKEGIPLSNIDAGVGTNGRLFLETLEEHVEERILGANLNARLVAALAGEDMHVLLENSRVPESLRASAQLVHEHTGGAGDSVALYAVSARRLLEHAVGGKEKARRLTRKERARIVTEAADSFVGLDPDDDKILMYCMWLKERYGATGKDVRLITKDVNLYIYGWQLGIHTEDYEDDRVEAADLDILTRGLVQVDWDDVSDVEIERHGECHVYRFTIKQVDGWHCNQGVYLAGEDGEKVLGLIRDVRGTRVTVETVLDRTGSHHDVYGIQARNLEQNLALHALMDPEIDLVVLDGSAGTGKTLMALAAGLQQVSEPGEHRRYDRIVMSRAPIPVGVDIGFLPGTEEEKMTPWMGALGDNLEVLIPSKGHPEDKNDDWGRAATEGMLKRYIQIKSMSFMRGRSFVRKWIIFDEAQNLTPKQVKTLITRAGEGTKVVVMGNVAQIDNPYLNRRTNGLSYLAVHAAKWRHAMHIILQSKERSRLATWGEETL